MGVRTGALGSGKRLHVEYIFPESVIFQAVVLAGLGFWIADPDITMHCQVSHESCGPVSH